MGWFNKIIGSISGNVAEVDAGNNLKTTTPQASQRLGGVAPDKNNVGAVVTFFEHDAGAYTGVRDLRSPKVTENGNLIASSRTLLWHGMFPAASQNTATWKHLFTTMTTTQAGDGFALMNANLTATTATGCMLQTWRYFNFFDQSTFSPVLQVSMVNGNPVANQVMEWGIGSAVAATAPSDGIYFRYTSSGLYGYVKFGANAEIATGLLLAANALALNVTYDFSFTVDERGVGFYLGANELGSISIPSAQSNIMQSISAPMFSAQRNIGAVAGTQAQMKLSCTSVVMDDLGTNLDFYTQMGMLGQSYQGMDGGTMGSLAVYSNAALAAAAALTNTTAAAGNTGLGGAVLVLPTLTSGTDGILLAYQNPLGTLQAPAKTLIVYGVHIDAAVHTALTGGPLNYIMGVAYGSTAVSLATADSASFANNTTKSPRRIVLGSQNFAAAAAAGVDAKDIFRPFTSPIIVNPGEWFCITARNMGTVTTLGDILFTVDVDHIFM